MIHMNIIVSLVESDLVPQGHIIVYARESEAQLIRSVLDKMHHATKVQVANDIGMPWLADGTLTREPTRGES